MHLYPNPRVSLLQRQRKSLHRWQYRMEKSSLDLFFLICTTSKSHVFYCSKFQWGLSSKLYFSYMHSEIYISYQRLEMTRVATPLPCP
jgi:hypothetical protein